jgi:hypothetical protein
VYGVDLAREWASRRWVGLLELVDALPATSRLNEAIHNDPVQAAAIASRPTGDRQWSPPLREWTTTTVMLQRLIFAAESTVALLGGAKRAPELFPSPVTLGDELAEEASRTRQLQIVAAATPDALPPPVT